MRNCVAHRKSEAGLKIEFISALELSCWKAACRFLGQRSVTAELTASKAAKKNQKHQTVTRDCRKKVIPVGSNNSNVLSDQCLTRQFNHQIDGKNIQAQVQGPCLSPPRCLYTSGLPGIWLCTWALLRGPGCFGHTAAQCTDSPASPGSAGTAQIYDCFIIKAEPATEPFCFLDHHSKTHRICLDYPVSAWYLRRKKGKKPLPRTDLLSSAILNKQTW